MRKALALLLPLVVAFCAGAAIPPAENLLPQDTLFIFTIPDCAALRTAAHQSPPWLFWTDPAMKPFRDNFTEKLRESFIAPFEQDLGMKVSDFKDLLQGQLTLAVTQNGWTGGDDPGPGMLLLLDARDKSGLLKTNLDNLKQKWTAAGKPLHTEEIRGIPFSVVTLSSNDFPSLTAILPHRQPVQELGRPTEPDKPSQIVIGQVDSLLIVGNSISAVEPVAAHLKGSLLPSLNDDAVFAADKLSQFHDSPLYYGWLNAHTLSYVLSHIPPEAPNPEAPTVLPAPQWTAILDALGLTGVKSASFAYRESRAGSQFNAFIAAPESSRKGLLKIFAPLHESAVPQSFIPADAVKFWRWRVDGQQAWAAIQKMVGDISPVGLAMFNAAISSADANAKQSDPDFDLEKNLIGNLGDDVVCYQKAPAGPTMADINSPPTLYLVGMHQGGPAATAINDLLDMAMLRGEKPPEPRDFAGHKIYTVPLRRPVLGGAGVPTGSFYVSSTSSYAAMSADVSVLEEYLRSSQKPPKPLSGTPGLIAAAQHVGGAGGGLFGYQNQREALGFLFKALKSEPESQAANPLSPMPVALPKLSDWFDFSLLPDFDQVSKYFYFSVYAGTSTPDGLSFKAFAPRPPELN